MGLARTLGIAGILLAVIAAPARAGDGDDAAAWLRKGKAAESIDHDPIKAAEAYRQALVLPEVSAAALEAGLRLLALYETTGDTAAALGTARAIATQYVPVMDEPTKELVLRALARLVPPGTIERSPLGTVISASPTPVAPEAEPSPLVRRFEDAFQDLSVRDPRDVDHPRLRADLLEKLRPLGADALPVLVWNIRSENLRKATEGMQLLTNGFPTQAVALLEQLALDADVLVRGPALSALLKLQASPAKWAALDRLRKVPSLASQASALRSRMEAEMTEEALLAQHALGGPEAPSWLRFALEKGAEPALRRALEVGAKDRIEVREWLVTLAAAGRYASASASARRDLEAFLRADPEAATNTEIRRGLAALAAAHVNDVPESDAAGRLAARRAAWARIVDMSPGEVVEAMQGLARAGGAAPPDLLADARFTAAFVAGWQSSAVSHDKDVFVTLDAFVGPESLDRAGPFWSELAALVLADPALGPKLLEFSVGRFAWKVPADLVDARWVAIAARDLPAIPTVTHPARFLATAAVQSQHPSFLTIYRKAAVEGSQRPSDALTEALPGYRGPELIDLLTDLVGRELPWANGNAAVRAGWTALLSKRAQATLTPAGLIDWIRKTRDDRPVAASILIQVLGTTASRAEIVSLLREEGSRTATLAPDYAAALVELAHSSKSADALPMLLRIYRESGDEDAANAMSMIGYYLNKLKALEGSTRQPQDVGTEVEASLSSDDPAVRIAGVQAIVVLERRGAIARLLKLIRTEKEAAVLDEANQMLRKLSKAVLDGQTPGPGAPDVHYYKELEFGRDGKVIDPTGKTPPAPAAPTPPEDVPLPGK